MKKQILLLGSLLFSTAGSAFASDSVSAPTDALVLLSSNVSAAVGMKRDELVAQFGEPTQKLSARVWVYADFRAKGRPARERSDALVVVFTGERVSLLRLTERAQIEAVLAKLGASAVRAPLATQK